MQALNNRFSGEHTQLHCSRTTCRPTGGLKTSVSMSCRVCIIRIDVINTTIIFNVIRSIVIPVPWPNISLFFYFVLWPTNAQLFHKLSHYYMFRRVATGTGTLYVTYLTQTIKNRSTHPHSTYRSHVIHTINSDYFP